MNNQVNINDENNTQNKKQIYVIGILGLWLMIELLVIGWLSVGNGSENNAEIANEWYGSSAKLPSVRTNCQFVRGPLYAQTASLSGALCTHKLPVCQGPSVRTQLKTTCADKLTACATCADKLTACATCAGFGAYPQSATFALLRGMSWASLL